MTNSDIILAIVFCLGAVIDEAQEDDYIARRSCSGARKLLLMKWMVVGFFFSISYKSVLRAMMIKIEYEKTMDTIDDMLQSDKQFMLASDVAIVQELVRTDPRKQVQILAEDAEYYEQGQITPIWVVEK